MCIYFKWSKSGFIFKNVVKVGIYLFQSWVSTSHFCLISAIVKILGTTPKTHLSCYQYSKLLKGGRVLKIFVQGTYMKRLTKKIHTWQTLHTKKNTYKYTTCLKFHDEEKTTCTFFSSQLRIVKMQYKNA